MIIAGILYAGAAIRYFLLGGWKMGIIMASYSLAAIVFAFLKIQ